MSTTIESLELEILSSSKSAESGLNALTASLEKLKIATKGGLGLTAVANQLRDVSDATSKVRPNDIGNVTGLAKAIQLLSGSKISPTIAKQITAMSTALGSADFAGSDEKIRDLVTSLQPLSELRVSKLTSIVNTIKKLPESLKNLDTRELYNRIQSLTRIMKPLADEMQKVANGFSAFPAKIQRLLRETDKMPKSLDSSSLSALNLYSKLKMATTAVMGIARKIGSAIKESNDYTENLNLFGVAMGKYAEGAKNYAEQVGELMGIDPSEWMRNQGIFMTLSTGFGIAGEKASQMSQNLTQLGYDLSSFFNISTEDAMLKLQSGLSGELEPLRRLGYDLSQAKLEATAASLGIDKAVSSMTQAEKAQLRYYAIMTQVTEVQGDMSETLESPANQLRIFKAQVTQAARAIGDVFIPILNAVLPYAIAVTKVIRLLANEIANLVGYKPPDLEDATKRASENTNALAENLETSEKEAKKLKSYMLGFDELNVFNPSESESADDVLSQFDFALPTYDFIGEATESRVSLIVKDMKEWLGITEDIKSWADLMNTRFGDILETVGLIGIAFASWKIKKGVNTFMTKTLPELKKLVKTKSFQIILGVTLAVKGLLMGAEVIQDALTGGLESVKVSEVVGSAGLIIGGGALIGNAFGKALMGAAIGAIVVGVAGLGVGLYDAIKNELDVANGLTIAFSVALIGAGIGYLAHGILGAAMGTLAGIVIGGAAAGAIWIIQNVESTTEKILGIVSAASLALGAILAFTGANIPLGVGLMVAGAVGLASNIAMNSKLSDDVKGTIAIITAAVSTAMLAVGAVLAFTGASIPLGISLMAGGALAMGSAVIPKWNELSDGVKQTISRITGIVGASLLGIGAVLAFTGIAIPLGIGLMAAGAISLGTSIALNWNTLPEKLRGELGKTVAIVGAASLALGAILAFTGVAIPLGIALMVAGAASLATVAALNWDSLKNSLQGTLGKILAIVGAAAMVIGIILLFTGVGIPLGLGLLIGGAASLGTAIAFNWDFLIGKVKGIFDAIKNAWNSFWNFIKGGINGFLGGIEWMVNGVIKGLNIMIGALNKINFKIPDWVPGLGGKSFGINIKEISSVSIPRLAEGGFPDMGQIFIAREAGPELVGNIGSRTAVVNNDQIVESVSAGVYQAVVAALGSGSGDEGNTQIVINLDGEKIYENQQKVARSRGYNLGMGAFSFG